MGELISCANLAWRISEEGVGEWIAGIRRTIDTYRFLIAGHSLPAWKWSPAHRWESIFLFGNQRFIVGFVTPLSVVHLVIV